MTEPITKPKSRDRLLAAAIDVIRQKGYSATRIEDICAVAGVTKGSFFHHFATKDDLALAATTAWNEMAEAHFAASGTRDLPDPRDRLLAYVAMRKAILFGDVWGTTCLLGTMLQDTYRTHPDLGMACAAGIDLHIATLIPDADAAIAKYGRTGDWTGQSLADHIQAVVQGALLLAKADGNFDRALGSFDHLYNYVALVFHKPIAEEVTS